MARLFVLSGASLGATFDLEGTVVIGRGDEADLVLREPSISRKHARLVPRDEPGAWKVVDLGSSNGVHVGGKRVRTAIVRDGETFVLGDIELRLRDESAAEPAAERPAVETGGAPAAPAAAPELPAELELELEFEDGPGEAPAAAARPASSRPAISPPGSRSGSSSGSPSGSPGAGAKAASDRTGARATQEREARRRAAMGGGPRPTGGASVTATATGAAGRPVLQYSQTRRGGVDLEQLPAWKRSLIIAAALALAAGVAYGAFSLTRTARSQASALSE